MNDGESGTVEVADRIAARFFPEAQRLGYFLRIQAGAPASTTCGMVEFLKRVLEGTAQVPSDWHLDPNLQGQIEKEKDLAAFAEYLARDGESFVVGLACLKLWAIFEAVLEDIAVAWLHEPSRWATEPIQALKGPVVEFALAGRSEQARFISEQIGSATKASLKGGVGRFEAVFHAVGLSGPVEDRVRRVLFEFSQVRNVLAHRAGVADRRFCEAVPWFRCGVGDELPLTGAHFYAYYLSAGWYLLEIINRLRRALGRRETEAGKYYLELLERGVSKIEAAASSSRRANSVEQTSNGGTLID